MTTITFKNAKELAEYCVENNKLVGQVWVESNPGSEGTRTLLNFYISGSNSNQCLYTAIYGQADIGGVDYWYGTCWYDDYKGTFELVLDYCNCQFKKPEVYKVGDYIEVVESIKEVGENFYKLSDYEIGATYKIERVYDDAAGVYYVCEDMDDSIPFYCVRKVEQPIKEMTINEIQEKLGYKIKIIE